MNRMTKSFGALLVASLALAACEDSGATGEGGGGRGGDGGAVATGGAGGGQGGSGGGGAAGGAGGQGGGVVATTAEIVATLDPAKFELPEGLLIDGEQAIVGFALTGAIEKIGLADGVRSAFASLPPPPPNTSFLTGLGLDGEGLIHGALVSFTPDATAGVYRGSASGGSATLWATHPSMVFPNALVWDDAGILYVTDSAVGGVFRVAKDGTAELWATDPLLEGNPPACGAPADSISVGANGAVWTKEGLYVAGSDQGVLVRIPIGADGKAGALETVAGPDCDALAGIDGIALDEDGSIVAAVNRKNRVVRISKAGAVTVLFEGAPLDFPASVAFGGEGAERALYVTSFALGAFLGGTPASPALVRLKPGE